MNLPNDPPPIDPRPTGKPSTKTARVRKSPREVVGNLIQLIVLLTSPVLWPFYFVFDVARAIWTMRHLLFDFSGRLPRSFVWACMMIYVLYGLIAGVIIQLVKEKNAIPSALYWSMLGAPVFLPIAISAVAMGVKRLQDCDRSGWWLLLFYGVPAGSIGSQFIPGTPELVYTLVPVPFLVWAIVAICCLRGTPGPNRFGPETIKPAKKKA